MPPVSLKHIDPNVIARMVSFCLSEEIRKALKAMNLLKVLEGKEAVGNKSNTKDIGEHKVSRTGSFPIRRVAKTITLLPTSR
jgi:hypothetical protein